MNRKPSARQNNGNYSGGGIKDQALPMIERWINRGQELDCISLRHVKFTMRSEANAKWGKIFPSPQPELPSPNVKL